MPIPYVRRVTGLTHAYSQQSPCSVFVAVAAIAAIFLTTMLLDARSEWLKRVTDREEQIKQIEEDLRKKKLVVSDLENQVNRHMINWGRAWELTPQDIQLLDAEQGVIMLAAGSNLGLAVREANSGAALPTLHVFGTAEDGTSAYIGAFRVTQVQQDQVAAQMVRKPYPGEIEQWQANGGLRVWNSVPGNWQSLHALYQSQIAEALQDVQDEQGRLTTQADLKAKSEEQLARRMGELEGNEQAVDGASEDVINGLVQTLRSEEAERDDQLHELDELRHEYHAKYNELVDLLEQNRNLEQQLPQPTSKGDPPALPASARQTTSSSHTALIRRRQVQSGEQGG